MLTPRRLTYWVVFGFFNFIETFVNVVLYLSLIHI